MVDRQPLGGGYQVTRWLFLRLLGVVYLIAFVSLAVQVAGLIGPNGLLPAQAFLDGVHSLYGSRAYRLLPTVFWLGAGSTALSLAAWIGAGLAVLLIVGIAPRVALAGAWGLYLSLAVAGQDFLSFQWDGLLLETGLLALLWAPPGWRPSRQEPPASAPVRWLLVLLLFKLMFLSGATKLLSGDPTWRHLTALDYHFETQPLPTWPGWYAHQSPAWTHRLGTAGMFVVELGAPWLLFAPSRFRALRYAGVAGLVLLQTGIALTGNYGFFNLLAIVLCIPALDDRVLGWVAPARSTAAGSESPAWRGLLIGIVPVIALVSALSAWAEIAYTLPDGRGRAPLPGWGSAMLGWVAPLRSFNGYGLFRVMTTERPEIVVEGSRDGDHWLEYEFRYKPGSLQRPPPFVEPYHPRLDWQMWFAALDPMQGLPLLQALAQRLRAGTPEVTTLLARNPFPDAPPRFIHFALYDYRFTTPAERRRSGAWWARELRGYLPDVGAEPGR